jgi:hypothetical protein
MIYNLADLIGKSYFANGDLGLTRYAGDGAKVVFTVKKGTSVGTVFSYLSPASGRTNSWLMFYDDNQKPYYVELKPGVTDSKALQQQGVKSEQQKTDEANAANMPTSEKIITLLKWGVGIAVIAYLAKEPIKNLLNAK